MSQDVQIPLLHRFRLHDMRPILEDDVEMQLGTGPNVILGGNGLGKTTIMQAIVYGLTGGNDGIEEDRRQRWDHRYFRKRLSPEVHKSSFVELELSLSKTSFLIRRGFQGSHLTGFWRKEHTDAWIENPHDATSAYERALTEQGGFANIDDFRFLVHRLLYLSESRQLLAWDFDAQLRASMSLNPDLVNEEQFRRTRETIKNLDSDKRHLRVAINKLEAHIAQSSSKETGSRAETAASDGLSTIVKELSDISRQRHELEAREATFSDQLSGASNRVESLRQQIEEIEASAVFDLISEQEAASSLALSKLTQIGICPSCGTVQHDLQAQALAYQRDHKCILCGSEHPTEHRPRLSTLLSQFSEKLRSKAEAEDQLVSTQQKVRRLLHRESTLRNRVNELRMQQLDVATVERDYVDAIGDPAKQKALMERQESEIEAHIYELKTDLERQFAAYRSAMKERAEWIGDRYTYYSTSFLGIPCSLRESPMPRNEGLRTFVPEFEDIVRDSPDSCSEAQRFFLDIAFRMALIDYATKRAEGPAIFFCETPETALDLSYVDNVVTMFQRFTEAGHTLVLTTNAQLDSIAAKLLKKIPKRRRRNRLLNLIEVGRLSAVQRSALPRLRQIVQAILE